jgi:hypothetical protein
MTVSKMVKKLERRISSGNQTPSRSPSPPPPPPPPAPAPASELSSSSEIKEKPSSPSTSQLPSQGPTSSKVHSDNVKLTPPSLPFIYHFVMQFPFILCMIAFLYNEFRKPFIPRGTLPLFFSVAVWVATTSTIFLWHEIALPAANGSVTTPHQLRAGVTVAEAKETTTEDKRTVAGAAKTAQTENPATPHPQRRSRLLPRWLAAHGNRLIILYIFGAGNVVFWLTGQVRLRAAHKEQMALARAAHEEQMRRRAALESVRQYMVGKWVDREDTGVGAVHWAGRPGVRNWVFEDGIEAICVPVG